MTDLQFNKTQMNEAIEAVLLGELDEDMRMIELFSGIDEDGRDFFAYIAVKPSKHAEYRFRLENAEAIDLEEYGEVLEHGYSALPPKEIQEKFKEEGCSYTFEDELKAFLNPKGNAA